MAQPIPYNPTFSFTDWATANPTDPLPGDEVDIQLGLLRTFTLQVCTNLALIQRDDGALANGSVGIDQLSPEIDIGLASVTDWATGVAYVVRDAVWFGGNLYRCEISHTSDTFSTDLAAGRWFLLLDIQQFLDAAEASADAAAADAAATAADRVQTGIDATAAQAAAAAAAASANGFKPKGSVRAATTAALAANTYANGAGGVGATLTGNANGALAAQDGVTLAAGELLLVKDEVAALKNGIYSLTQVGSAGTPYILTRVVNMDTWAEVPGATVTVEEGTANAETSFICTANQGGTIGVTAITWQNQLASLVDGSVTAAKIATDAVTTAKVQNGAVNGSKLGAITSAELRAAMTDETGTGAAVFADSPALTGNPTVPTQTARDKSTKAASTDYADTAARLTLGTLQNTTSGTNIDFTSIPAGVREIVISFLQVSSNGTSDFLVQLGDSGGIENTGYVSTRSWTFQASPTGSASNTTGFVMGAVADASYSMTGQMRLVLMDASTNQWSESYVVGYSGAVAGTGHGGGNKSLSAELDRLRITTISGHTFDSGSINIAFK